MNKPTECQVNKANASINSEQCKRFVNNFVSRRTKTANCQRYLQCHSIDRPQPKHSITMPRTLRVERGANVHRTHLKRLPQNRQSTTIHPSQSSHHHIYHTNATQYDAFVDTIHDNLSSKSSRSYCTQHIFSRLFLVIVSIIVFLLQEINCDQGKFDDFLCHIVVVVDVNGTTERFSFWLVFFHFRLVRNICSCSVRHN